MLLPLLPRMEPQLCGGMTTRQYRLRKSTLAHAQVTQRSTDTPCCPTRAADHSVFVGDLAPEVNDYTLQEHFRQYFSSVRSAKVRPRSLLTGWAVQGVTCSGGLRVSVKVCGEEAKVVVQRHHARRLL